MSQQQRSGERLPAAVPHRAAQRCTERCDSDGFSVQALGSPPHNASPAPPPPRGGREGPGRSCHGHPQPRAAPAQPHGPKRAGHPGSSTASPARAALPALPAQGPLRVGRPPPPGRRTRPQAAPGPAPARGPPAPRRPPSGRAAPYDAPTPRSDAARAPRARLRPRRAYPESTAALPAAGPTRERSPPAAEHPHRARGLPGAPIASRGLTGAGPARRSSGPSSDGKWRALLLLLMDGGATPATRGVSRNCFQGPLLHPLRTSRSERAVSPTYRKREAEPAVTLGDQSEEGSVTNRAAPSTRRAGRAGAGAFKGAAPPAASEQRECRERARRRSALDVRREGGRWRLGSALRPGLELWPVGVPTDAAGA